MATTKREQEEIFHKKLLLEQQTKTFDKKCIETKYESLKWKKGRISHKNENNICSSTQVGRQLSE